MAVGFILGGKKTIPNRILKQVLKKFISKYNITSFVVREGGLGIAEYCIEYLESINFPFTTQGKVYTDVVDPYRIIQIHTQPRYRINTKEKTNEHIVNELGIDYVLKFETELEDIELVKSLQQAVKEGKIKKIVEV